ncbi:MAG TPA: hypothetical protein VK060_01360 [Ruania sp.]|nr:hypothetical protein [Ruania sp.]
MSTPRSAGRRTRWTIALVLGVLLAALMVYPWPEHTPEPIILGVVPAPLFAWIVWVAAFIAYVAWICYRWDPYAAVVQRFVDEQTERSGGQEVQR